MKWKWSFFAHLLDCYYYLQFVLCIWYLAPNSKSDCWCYQVPGSHNKNQYLPRKTNKLHQFYYIVFLQSAVNQTENVTLSLLLIFCYYLFCFFFLGHCVRWTLAKWTEAGNQLDIALFITLLLRQFSILDYCLKNISLHLKEKLSW